MLKGFRLTASHCRRSCWTGCGIAGRLILSVGSESKPLMMRALETVLGLFQVLLWITTWSVVHLPVEDWWGNTLEIQRWDDTLSWETLAIGSTSLLWRWRRPFQVSWSSFCLHFVALKATDSALLCISILIWSEVSVFLIAIRVPWYYLPLLCFGIGSWLCIRNFFPLFVY